MPFMTTLLPTEHVLDTLHGCFFPMFSDRILTPELLALWPQSHKYRVATTFLESWAPPHLPSLREFLATRDTLMVELCINNACRAGVHVGLTDGAVRRATEEGDRFVYTVSMPYNKAGPYMCHCNTHTVTTHRAKMYSVQPPIKQTNETHGIWTEHCQPNIQFPKFRVPRPSDATRHTTDATILKQ